MRVLIVEDNAGDVVLVREALRESSLDAKLTHISDGDTAIEYIRSIAGGAIAPELIVLDLNLPKRDGWEVLQFLRASPSMEKTPVVIFSSSNAPEDLRKAKAAENVLYIRKPSSLDDYLAIGKQIEGFYRSEHMRQ